MKHPIERVMDHKLYLGSLDIPDIRCGGCDKVMIFRHSFTVDGLFEAVREHINDCASHE